MIKKIIILCVFLQVFSGNTYADVQNQNNVKEQPIQEIVRLLQKEVNNHRWAIYKSYLKQIPVQGAALYCFMRGIDQIAELVRGKINFCDAQYMHSYLFVLVGWWSLERVFSQSREQLQAELKHLEAQLEVYSKLIASKQ